MPVQEAKRKPADSISKKIEANNLRPLPANGLKYNPDWYPARQRLFGKFFNVVDRIPDQDEIVKQLADQFWEGDDLMDAVSAMFLRLPPGEGRKLFEQALEKGIDTLTDPPAELVALFKQLDQIPSWIDMKQVDRGAVVAANISPAGKAAGVFLNTIQTVQGGAVGAAVGATGRMQRDALQRARESAAFWVGLPKAGGLSRFGGAFKTAVRVRLMHAQARSMLLRKWGKEWFEQNGNPIPNAAMIAGVPTFGIANLMYDVSFGKQYTRQDMEDIHMFWTYIGYVLGANEKILARTPEDGMKMLDFVLSIMPPPSQYADELNRISNLLLDTLMNAAKFPIFDAKLKQYMLEALNGFYFYVGGDFLGSRITETAKPTLVGKLVPYAVKAGVMLSNIERFIPGRAERMERHREVGDPFWNVLVEQFAKLAEQQNDTRKPVFNVHDTSKADDIGAPWQAS